MADAPRQERSGMSRGLRIVLVLSLALNLLVAGAAAGAWLRFKGPAGELASRAAVGFALFEALPRAERRALRQSLGERLDRGVIRRARIGPELDAVLRAEPFDPEAALALVDRQANAMLAGQSAMRDGWIAVVTEMSPEAREAYADRLREKLRKSRRGPPPGGRP